MAAATHQKGVIVGEDPGGENRPVRVGYGGDVGDGVCTTRKDLAAVTITTITTIWTPATAAKRIIVYGMDISVSAAMNVLLEDNSASADNFVWRTPKLEADKPYSFRFPKGIRLSAANRVLKATGSAAGAVTGTVYGEEVTG